MENTVPEEPEIIEIVLTPVPPDSVQSIRPDIVAVIEEKLHESGHGDLLTNGQISIEVEQTFPTDAETLAILVTLGTMAKDTYKELILPLLKRRYGVEEKPREKKSNKKDAGKKKEQASEADNEDESTDQG